MFSNVAETLVSKGLATVVRYRQDDDQRSSHYHELLAAEDKAAKSFKGIHGKKEQATIRVHEINVSKLKLISLDFVIYKYYCICFRMPLELNNTYQLSNVLV